MAILAEGSFTPLACKTAEGVLRYCRGEVAAVIDSTRAGRTAQDCVGFGGAIPVVADLPEAAARGADSLLIGIAPQGGDLPHAWRALVVAAVARGWDVLSGLHVFLADDPELARLARGSGAALLDVRRPPASRPVATGRAASVDALVALTVGSDCNVGKMTAALELCRELERRQVRVSFVATGQTGIFVADQGVAVDAVPADFVAGIVEELVIEAAHRAQVVLVEGQGALRHPGYSGVTLSLLHGAAPEALVLCHHSGRQAIRAPDAPAGPPRPGESLIPPLPVLVREYEQAAAWVRPARVVGIALNTLGQEESAARRAVENAARATRLPVCDPVRFGAGALAEALIALRAARRPHATAP